MSKKHENPYREGCAYHRVFEDWRKSGNVGMSRTELHKNHSVADVTVVLSPRETSKRGDCRGNYSAQGHIYFAATRKVEDEEKRFVLRWRKTELEPRVRHQGEVKAEKVKTTHKVTTKTDESVTA